MSALADALVAAQRRALSALEKAYLGGVTSEDALRAQLDAIGCNDVVDQDRLVAALTVIGQLGASLPSEPTAIRVLALSLTEAERAYVARKVKR